MRTVSARSLMGSVLLGGFLVSTAAAQMPSTEILPVIDTYYGLQVTDNYRWLEDLNSPDVKQWFQAQHDWTEKMLDRLPGRDSLVNTLMYYNSLRPATFSGIVRKGGVYFYKKTRPDETVGKLYCRIDSTGEESLLYDAGLDERGQPLSISYFVPSEDGKLIAFGLASGGGEVATLRVMDVHTKSIYPEKIFPSWFGPTGWSPDNRGFIYTAEITGDHTDPEFLLNDRSLYHVVGTDPAKDHVVLSRTKYPELGILPEDLCYVYFTEDLRYLIGVLGGVNNELNCFYAPAAELLNPVINWKRLFVKDDKITNFVARGDELYGLTYAGAPQYKIIKTTFSENSLARAETVVPEGKDKISALGRSKDFLYYVTTDGINSHVFRLSLAEGIPMEVALPVPGTATISPYDILTDDARISVTSWSKPLTQLDFDGSTGALVTSFFNTSPRYPGVDDLVIEEVEVPSHDGTMVPLSIIYHKAVKRNGSAVCFMTGYGAYGSANTPYFSLLNLAILNKGVIVAETHPRGGSEKGEEWYKAGYKLTKPNTWKDFIACGEYLVRNGYTRPQHLIGEGTSAGGILIGRAITDRPDLFAAAISNVSCSNALRFENTPNGPNNAREFGTVKDSAECMALYEMDSYHHVKDGTPYPAVICVGGMNDPRVLAWQPAKFAAALQNASSSGKPVLLKVNYDDGHFTEDKQVAYRNFATMYAFALWQAGHPDFQPAKTHGALPTVNQHLSTALDPQPVPGEKNIRPPDRHKQ